MQASLQVLGVSYEDLGIGVAKVLEFPGAARPEHAPHRGRAGQAAPTNDGEKLRALSSLSAGIVDAMREATEQGPRGKTGQADRHDTARRSASPRRRSRRSIKESRAELARDAVVLNLKTDDSAF